jgi:catechol 2,3-dioxygenase-like lactoylglutathione lyase family enzyme
VSEPAVRELRLVVTVPDYATAVAFYRDLLGMQESAEYISEDAGRVIILSAGRATLEIGDEAHAAYIDELEVGRRVAGPVRVALQVDTVDEATSAATAGGASLVAAAVDTPWGSRNSRLDAPGDLHVTLFEDRTPTSEG